MRIAIFTEPDYTFMFRPWLKTISQLQKTGHTVVGFYLFPERLGRYQGFAIHKYYLQTFGPKVFLTLSFKALKERFSQIIENIIKKKPISYRQIQKRFGIPVRFAKNPNDDAIKTWLLENKIDILVISCGYIIKSAIIKSVRTAVLNKHSALLPANRGLFPVFWTLLEGVLPVGTTIHKVDEGIDTGEILYQQSYETPIETSVFQYYQRIFADLPNSLMASIEILEGKREKTVFSPPPQASYHSLPSKSDYRKFLERGLRFV